ncbi:MAG: hypothetical protein M1838_000069 [Thelocarpon superellum]|nr:MAG: hypothetical protein M1838_000069 [Thelocarpon superellum]
MGPPFAYGGPKPGDLPQVGSWAGASVPTSPGISLENMGSSVTSFSRPAVPIFRPSNPDRRAFPGWNARASEAQACQTPGLAGFLSTNNDDPWNVIGAAPKVAATHDTFASRVSSPNDAFLRFRTFTPSEAETFGTETLPSDSGYATKSLATQSVADGDDPDAEQDFTGITGQVSGWQLFSSETQPVAPTLSNMSVGEHPEIQSRCTIPHCQQQDLATHADLVQHLIRVHHVSAGASLVNPPLRHPPSEHGSSRTGSQERTLVCVYCGRQCRNPSLLRKHVARHEKPYVCVVSECPREDGFANRNDLIRHMHTVHKESCDGKVWYCPSALCKRKEKAWRRRDNMSIHLKKVHESEDYEDLYQRAEEAANARLRPLGATPEDASTRDAQHPQNSSCARESAFDVTVLPDCTFRQPDWSLALGTYDVSANAGDFEGLTTAHPSNCHPDLLRPAEDVQGDLNLSLSRDPVLHGLDLTLVQADASSAPLTPQAPTSKLEHPPSVRETAMTEDDAPLVADPSPLWPDSSWTEFITETLRRCEQDVVVRVVEALRQERRQGRTEDCSDSSPTSSSAACAASAPKSPDPKQAGGDKGPEEKAGVLRSFTPRPDEMMKRVHVSFMAHLSEMVRQYQDEADDAGPEDFSRCGRGGSRNRKTIVCPRPHCMKQLLRPCDLRKHLKRHDLPYFCTFLGCKRRFASKMDWKQHENAQHTHEELWRCRQKKDGERECTSQFSRPQNFVHHLKKHHAMEDREATRMETRERHVSLTEPRDYWCGFCRRMMRIRGQAPRATDDRFDHIASHIEKQNQDGTAWRPDPARESIPLPVDDESPGAVPSPRLGSSFLEAKATTTPPQRDTERCDGPWRTLSSPKPPALAGLAETEAQATERRTRSRSRKHGRADDGVDGHVSKSRKRSAPAASERTFIICVRLLPILSGTRNAALMGCVTND